jgi:N-carbamoylputrescine amidase
MTTGPRRLRVALVQMHMTPDAADNEARAEAAIRAAAGEGAQLVCLPELFRTPYFCQVEDADLCDLAEPIPGPSTTRFAALAKELGVALVLSLFERRAAGLYHNTAVVLDAHGELVHRYRKMHIPDDPKYYEKFYFTPGDLGFGSVEVAGVRLGVLVCWDQWYPEAARLTALTGAELLVYPTAIGWHPAEKAEVGAAQRDAWITIQRSHAIANGCHVLAINRTGFELTPGTAGAPSASADGIEFWGSTFVAGPDGVVLAQAASTGDAVIVHDLDLDASERQRRGWPFLRDRRIDAYGGITRRFLDGA